MIPRQEAVVKERLTWELNWFKTDTGRPYPACEEKPPSTCTLGAPESNPDPARAGINCTAHQLTPIPPPVWKPWPSKQLRRKPKLAQECVPTEWVSEAMTSQTSKFCTLASSPEGQLAEKDWVARPEVWGPTYKNPEGCSTLPEPEETSLRILPRQMNVHVRVSLWPCVGIWVFGVYPRLGHWPSGKNLDCCFIIAFSCV